MRRRARKCRKTSSISRCSMSRKRVIRPSLTSTLNQRADAALQKAKGVNGVTARTGSFSIYPSTDRDGRISAWRGRTEVVLESHDFAAASKLAGQMASIMQVGNVQFSLSPEAQRAAEQKLTGEAIKSFRRAGRFVRAGIRLQRLFDSRGQRRAQRRHAASHDDDERTRNGRRCEGIARRCRSKAARRLSRSMCRARCR